LERPRRAIDRRSVASVARLRLRARTAVEGFYAGIHKSPYHGFNVEFSEYRDYAPGDDLRRLDWRVFARTERHFVKQFEAETNLSAYLLLDASGSMAFSGRTERRLDYAASLAAALALLLLRQGDHVGLVTFDDDLRLFIPPRAHARHFGVLVDALENVRPGRETDIAGVLHRIAERVRRRSMVIVISDFLDDVERVLNGLHHFRHRRHEVIALHVLDETERDFPFDRVVRFEDLEGDDAVVVDPAVVADGYRAAFKGYLDALRRGCRENAIDYELMWLSEPFDRALAAYLARRR